MEIIKKSILGVSNENTALDTEFVHNLFAEIGPLQLGVVLVFGLFKSVFLQKKYGLHK